MGHRFECPEHARGRLCAAKLHRVRQTHLSTRHKVNMAGVTPSALERVCVCVFTDGYASKRRRLDRVVTGRANCCLGSSVCKETSENSAVCSLPVTLPRSVPAHAPQVISFLSLLSFPLIDFQM